MQLLISKGADVNNVSTCMYNYCYIDSLPCTVLAGLFYVWPNLCSSLSGALSASHAFTILCILEGKGPFLNT